MRHTPLVLLLTALLVPACGRDTENARARLAGVGSNPSEIGPTPKQYGGLVEYDWVDFAGGGLSLGGLGLISYDEILPATAMFKPPYAAIYGLAFLFDDLVSAPDAHHGSMGVAPPVDNNCWTTYEPFSLLSASTVDAGDSVRFRAEGDSTLFDMGRYPEIYPPDPQDVFVYYIGINSWQSQPLYHYVPGDGTDTESMVQEVLRPSNYTAGDEVRFEFDGGISPREAPVGSIPLPSAYKGEGAVLTLPAYPGGVLLSWSGPAYDEYGTLRSGDSGDTATCFRYQAGEEVPTSAEDCVGQPGMPLTEGNVRGQIYTGPWETNAGLDFQWESQVDAESPGVVFINVRFLSPVDRDSEYLSNLVVEVEATNAIQNSWDNAVASGEAEGDLPQGYRSALPCDDEEDIEEVFNPSLLEADGDPILPLRGDPSSNLVEVTCRLADDGQFTLLSEHVQDAYEYAIRSGAEGATFSFGRFNESEMTVPDVMDQQGFRREISPILLKSHAIKMGRFWLETEGN